MQIVTGEELKIHLPFFKAAAEIAEKATCLQAHCGSIIVSNGEIIGEGYNSPPLDKEENRTCGVIYQSNEKVKYDKTCCIHAEWRAVLDACKKNADKIFGSTIYFMRIDDAGNFTPAGKPFCTNCSRIVMESGINKFALWQGDEAHIYEADEYDRISYAFFQPI